MAGLPLKSGADFYNLEAARLRLHNLGADPTEVGAGLIYFNTSTGLNTSQKARLYTGSAWKTIAFSEDLDVASNADFLALKDRVDLLSGDVDTDAIISNMKEVSAFLEGFAEDASLMDYLNTELGKKLDISGGEMTGKLVMYNRISMGNQVIEMGKGLFGAYNDGEKLYWLTPSNETWNEILTSAGGTIEGNYDALTIKRNSSYASLIRYANADGVMGYLGFSNENTPAWYPSDLTTSYALLHSGNVGKYALKIDGSNEMTGALLLNHTNPRIAFMAGGKSYGSLGYFADGLKWYVNSENAYHAIAFTDSNVAGAKTLVNDAGDTILIASNSNRLSDWQNLQLYESGSTGVSAYPYYQTFGSPSNSVATVLQGGALAAIKVNGAERFWLNSSGNVTIGASDHASSDYKLFVYGNSVFADASRKGDINTTKISSSAIVEITAIAKGNDGLYIGQLANSTAWLQSAYGGTDANASSNHTYPLSLQPLGGNVLIGTTTDNGSGAKLQVNGSVSIADNILFGSSGELDKYGNFHFTKDAGTWSLVRYNGEDAVCIYNSTGNVLIGTTTDDESGAKLQVAGNIVSESITHRASISDNAITHYNKTNGGFFLYGGIREGEALSIEIAGNTGSWVGNGITLKQNGNVGIGTTTPSARLEVYGNIAMPNYYALTSIKTDGTPINLIYCGNDDVLKIGGILPIKLQGNTTIGGDLHVTGNIIADGEVSAGGAGTEGGGSSSGGGGAFHSESIAVGATQTTIAHGLGTDDIVVSIYEKDGVSGRWSIILTDVEIVDANNIIVSFGSATAVEHKVVIMGAVA